MLSYPQNKEPYHSWIRKNEGSYSEIMNEFPELRYRPLISVIIPVYNPPYEIFNQTINSILSQSYSNYEICIANASSDRQITEFLEKVCDNKVSRLKNISNNGIAENTNEALGLARGEFVAFLDHDDLLSRNALLKVADELNTNQNIDLMYSDSDKITEDGIRYEPFFKPDFSPELMLCCNYMTHLCVIRKSIIDKIGGISLNVEGAQDWDLILRVLEKTKNVRHITEILYHWRTLVTSTATSMNVKPEAFNSQIVAVTRHLERMGFDAYVIHNKSMYLDCNLYSYKPPVTVVIIVQGNDIDKFLSNLLPKTAYPLLEVILVSNGSIQIDSQFSETVKRIEHIEGNEYNLCNEAIKNAKGQILVFLHDDIFILKENWLKELVCWFQIEDIGCVGSKITSPKETILHEGIILNKNHGIVSPFDGLVDRPMWTPFGATDWYRNCDSIVIDGMAVRRKTLLEIKGFSENENADIEFCAKLRNKGLRVLCNPRSKLRKNTRSNPYKKRLEKYHNKCNPKINYYNPNLEKGSVLKIKT